MSSLRGTPRACTSEWNRWLMGGCPGNWVWYGWMASNAIHVSALYSRIVPIPMCRGTFQSGRHLFMCIFPETRYLLSPFSSSATTNSFHVGGYLFRIRLFHVNTRIYLETDQFLNCLYKSINPCIVMVALSIKNQKPT